MNADLIGQLPGAVLFACNFNRVRSPMAEALTKLMYGTSVYVDSAGLKPEEGVDPFVTIVIDESTDHEDIIAQPNGTHIRIRFLFYI